MIVDPDIRIKENPDIPTGSKWKRNSMAGKKFKEGVEFTILVYSAGLEFLEGGIVYFQSTGGDIYIRGEHEFLVDFDRKFGIQAPSFSGA